LHSKPNLGGACGQTAERAGNAAVHPFVVDVV
jgi:hypothetical protein